jgi:hypothetical protein
MYSTYDKNIIKFRCFSIIRPCTYVHTWNMCISMFYNTASKCSLTLSQAQPHEDQPHRPPCTPLKTKPIRRCTTTAQMHRPSLTSTPLLLRCDDILDIFLIPTTLSIEYASVGHRLRRFIVYLCCCQRRAIAPSLNRPVVWYTGSSTTLRL